MCGVDRSTIMYLLAELARRIGKNDEAKRYVSKVLVARNAQRRTKDKAFALKERLFKAKRSNQSSDKILFTFVISTVGESLLSLPRGLFVAVVVFVDKP